MSFGEFYTFDIAVFSSHFSISGPERFNAVFVLTASLKNAVLDVYELLPLGRLFPDIVDKTLVFTYFERELAFMGNLRPPSRICMIA